MHWHIPSRLGWFAALLVAGVTWTGVAAGLSTDETDEKAAFKQAIDTWHKTISDATAVLKSIERGSNVTDFKKRLIDLELANEKALEKTKAFPQDKFMEIRLQHNVVQMQKIDDELLIQYKRLQETGQLKSLSGLFPITYLDNKFEVRTCESIKWLESDIDFVTTSYGLIPTRLAALLEPINEQKPLITKDRLLDSWGREIQYDFRGPRNSGNKPDIWSLGPLHITPGKEALIGNWRWRRKQGNLGSNGIGTHPQKDN